MLYYKDKNLKYTDMCIWFDNNFYKEDRDEERLYKYLYLLCVMLAGTKHYFKTSEEYDNFGMYAAGVIRLRMTSKYEREGKRVKSILNYLKGSIYGISCVFRSSEYLNMSDRRESNVFNPPDIELDRQDYQERLNESVNSFISDLKENFYSEIEYLKLNSYIKDKLYQQVVLNLIGIFYVDKKQKKLTPIISKIKKVKNKSIKLKFECRSLIAYEDICLSFIGKALDRLSNEVYEDFKLSHISPEDHLAIQKENVVSVLLGEN